MDTDKVPVEHHNPHSSYHFGTTTPNVEVPVKPPNTHSPHHFGATSQTVTPQNVAPQNVTPHNVQSHNVQPQEVKPHNPNSPHHFGNTTKDVKPNSAHTPHHFGTTTPDGKPQDVKPHNANSPHHFGPTSKDREIPIKDQQASVFGSKISATNEQFFGSLLDGISEGLNKADKDWTPTEKDREELTEMMKNFQNPLMAEIVGPDHLSQLNNLQNFFADSLKKIDDSGKSVDVTDVTDVTDVNQNDS
jgi:hypothetical protein